MLSKLRSWTWRARSWFARGHKRDTCWGGVSWFSRRLGFGFNEGGRWLCVVLYWRAPFVYVSAWLRWVCPRLYAGWDTERKRVYGGVGLRV